MKFFLLTADSKIVTYQIFAAPRFGDFHEQKLMHYFEFEKVF